jgi:epoxide hydrolase-like predicted phosphatase
VQAKTLRFFVLKVAKWQSSRVTRHSATLQPYNFATCKLEIGMIKAVIFDIGGVIIRTADHTSRRQWEKKLGLTEWESETIVFNSEMGTKAQSGAITEEELWQWVGQRLNLNGSELTEFRKGFWAGDELDTGLVDFIRKLKADGYQTAVISNATDNLQNALTNQFKIADAFDLIVGSATEKVMKPDPRIYQRTLDRLDRKPEEAVFIDDFAHNVQTAQELGMATIHFKKDTDVPSELEKLGVMIGE